MIAATRRAIKRLLKPLRLRLIQRQIRLSDEAIAHLRLLRLDAVSMEQIEAREQIRLAVRRIEIERG